MSNPKVAAIILAAGGSSRLGRPKQLLDWFGKPFICQLIDLTLQAKLKPVVVVTGASYQEIEKVIGGKNIVIARNEEWLKGQSSSMKVGSKALESENIDAFIIFLCDQPQVSIELIEKMIDESLNNEIDIVANSVQGKICPPTLFKVKCIDSIKSLNGDQGGRVLFKSYNTKIIDWQDVRLLQDSDTEEDYAKLVSMYKYS